MPKKLEEQQSHKFSQEDTIFFNETRKHLQELRRNMKDIKSETKIFKQVILENELRWRQIIANNFDLDSMFSCPIGTTYLYKFLTTEHNVENLQACLAVRNFKDFANPHDRERPSFEEIKERVLDIAKKYIMEDSEYEVNLPSHVKNKLNQMFKNLQNTKKDEEEAVQEALTVLDELDKELISNLMDPFKRFLNSDLMMELVTFIVLGHDTEAKKEEFRNAGKNGIILNNTLDWPDGLNARHPLTIVIETLESMLKLFQIPELYTKDGDLDFEKAKTYKSEKCLSWDKVVDTTSELSKVDLSVLKNEQDKKAFFINLYNLILIHAAVNAGGVPSITYSRELFFRQQKYNIGGYEFSLDIIKNGILRGNKSTFGIFGVRLKKNDPRSNFIVSYDDPSILFTLADMTNTSPKIEVYRPNTLENQISEMTREYLKENIKISKNNVIVPSLFAENKKDFQQPKKNSKQSIFEFIEKYLGENKISPDSKIQFMEQNLESDFSCVINSDKNFRNKISNLVKENIKKEQQVFRKRRNDILIQQSKPGKPTCCLSNFDKVDEKHLTCWVKKMAHPDSGLERKKYLYKLSSYDDCFTSKEGIKWILNNSSANKEKALKFLQFLADKNVIRVIDGGEIKDSNNQYLQFQTLLVPHCFTEVVKSGNLKFRTSLFSWSTRKVILYKTGIAIFKKTKLQHVYSLESPATGTIVIPNCIKFGQKNGFKLFISPYATLQFAAESNEDRDEWLKSLVSNENIVVKSVEDETCKIAALLQKMSNMKNNLQIFKRRVY